LPDEGLIHELLGERALRGPILINIYIISNNRQEASPLRNRHAQGKGRNIHSSQKALLGGGELNRTGGDYRASLCAAK